MAVRYDADRRRWTVEFEQAGVRVFRRLPKGSTEAQGKAYETKLRREIFDRETLNKIPTLTIQDATDQWLREDHRRKDRKKMASEAKQWEPFIRGRKLKDVPEVVQEAISQWCSYADKGGMASARHHAASATINRRLAMMKSVCRHAYKQGRIAENLSGRITVLREDNKREVYLTKPEIMRLSTCAPTSACKAAILLLAYSGLRVSELLAQTEQTLRSGTFVVPSSKSKTGKPRLVPVAEPAIPFLRMWLASQRPDYFSLRKQFLVARKGAKVGPRDLRMHDLRHSAASLLINAGVDIYTLSKILGHSSTQTTARYAHLYEDTLKDAIGRLR